LFGRGVKGRAEPILALLSLFLFSGACRKPPAAWEFFLADTAGNRLGNDLAVGQAARALYRPEEPTADQVSFQFFFRSEAENWEPISLVVEKPEAPAPEVACDLHTAELPPGSYLVLLVRNDEELSKLAFSIAPPKEPATPPPGRAAAVSPTPPPSPPPVGIEPAAGPKATPPPISAFEKFVAPAGTAPVPENMDKKAIDPEAMPTPESNLDPTPEVIEIAGPLPTPEAEVLGPEEWELAPGTEILAYGEDGYWHPAAVVRAYESVFTVRYFNPATPEEDLGREKFRVRALAEGMEVKFREGDDLIDGVIVNRSGRNFTVALKSDGSMREVSGAKIVVASP